MFAADAGMLPFKAMGPGFQRKAHHLIRLLDGGSAIGLSFGRQCGRMGIKKFFPARVSDPVQRRLIESREFSVGMIS